MLFLKEFLKKGNMKKVADDNRGMKNYPSYEKSYL